MNREKEGEENLYESTDREDRKSMQVHDGNIALIGV